MKTQKPQHPMNANELLFSRSFSTMQTTINSSSVSHKRSDGSYTRRITVVAHRAVVMTVGSNRNKARNLSKPLNVHELLFSLQLPGHANFLFLCVFISPFKF